MTTREELWQKWANQYINTQNPIPLFETADNHNVAYKTYGNDDRRILKRSEEMEDLVRKEGRKVINDWHTTDDTYDGLIYLMHWVENGDVVPLYVGKAGKYGKDGTVLTANLRGLRRGSTGKFARWGDGYDYHIGDLSAIIFEHHKKQKQNYQKWADRLFAGATPSTA